MPNTYSYTTLALVFLGSTAVISASRLTFAQVSKNTKERHLIIDGAVVSSTIHQKLPLQLNGILHAQEQSMGWNYEMHIKCSAKNPRLDALRKPEKIAIEYTRTWDKHPYLSGFFGKTASYQGVAFVDQSILTSPNACRTTTADIPATASLTND